MRPVVRKLLQMRRHEALSFKSARRSDVLWQIFIACDEMITGLKLPETFRLAQTGIALAYRWGSTCLKARAFAVLGSAHRANASYLFAKKSYEISSMQDRCPFCRADLKRRKAYLDRITGFPRQAMAGCNEALEIYRNEGDENLFGKALILRSGFFYFDHRYATALDDVKQAILLLDPKESFARMCGIHNLCAILAASNNLSHVNQACVLLSRLKERLKGARGLSLERAKLQWTEGLLAARILSTPRAIYLLESAQRKLIALGAAHDVAAITADLARLRCEDSWAVARALCRNTLADAKDLLEPEHASLLREIGAQDGDPLPLLQILRTNLPRPSVTQMPLPVV